MERFSGRLNRLVEFLLFVIGLAMALIVAAQVFARYVLNYSLFWSEELARYLLVWLTFLGATAAYHRKVHPGIDILTQQLGPSHQKAAALLVHLVSLVLFGVMLIYGCRFAYFVRLQISPALQLPKWIVISILPLSGLILLVHGLVLTMRELKGPPP